MECTHYFKGAGAKRREFRGWAGRVAGWPEKDSPKIEFGTWHPDHANLWNGGKVIFDCQPFDLVMFGANSAAMDPRDKTTQFGFAGLGTEGKLRIATLPKNTDARKIFAARGWAPPNSDLLVGDLQQCMQDSSITSARIKELITLLSADVCAGFGIHSAHLEEVLSIWPILSPIHSILATATDLAANKQKEAAIKRQHWARHEVVAAIRALYEAGEHPSNASIAAFLLNEPDRSAFKVKEKVRSLKKMLGDEFYKIECFNESET